MTTKCANSEAEIANDRKPLPDSEIMREESDRATAAIMVEHRKFVESLLNNIYVLGPLQNGRYRNVYSLADAIEMIENKNFWDKPLACFDLCSIAHMFENENEDLVCEAYVDGGLPEFHTEINKAVVMLANIVFGIDDEEIE